MRTARTKRSALVIGAGGGIGNALIHALCADENFEHIFAVSRDSRGQQYPDDTRLRRMNCDNSPQQITSVVDLIGQHEALLSRIIICNGILHHDGLKPEKALEQITGASMLEVLEANTVIPTLWLAALAKSIKQSPGSVVAALSARVGSLGDNELGGWYSYRASKAALNMILKSAAVELARRAPSAKLIAFHPGTTDTALSKPFQRLVPADSLLTPEFVASRLLTIMDSARADGALSYLDWAGEPIVW